MRKTSKFLSAILSVGMLSSLVSLNASAKTYTLSEFEFIDTGTYFDEHPYFSGYMILKQKQYGTYLIAYNSADNTIKVNGGQIEFLCYLLDTDEKYNAMSEYLSEKYPEYSLKHILEAGELSLKYGMGNYIIDTGKEMTEKEIFELATAIKNDTGYFFEMTMEADIPDELDCTGDVNSDYDINISDVLTVSAHINNKDKYPMEEQSVINGDVHDTGNGLNSSDAFMIQQYVTGIIDSL